MRMRPTAGHGRRLAMVAAVLVAALAASGCTSAQEVVVTVTTTPGVEASNTVTVPGASTPGAAGETSAKPPTTKTSLRLADSIRVAATPKFGTKDVPPNNPISITVFAGKIKNLTMTGDDASKVEGAIASDGATWAVTERLHYGVKYTVKGTAVASDGSTTEIKGNLTTVNPESTIRASFQREIANGETVGVAAPIILTFFEPIQDKAAAQRALKVTTDKGEIKGSWGWLQDEDVQGNGNVYSTVHFRPFDYWPANTKVHVEADLAGVDYGSGWGREDISADFKIGRSRVTKADIPSKHLVVFENGVIVKNYPVSYGKESEPGRTTVNGIHVITEKYKDFKMTNPQFGYFNVPEKWAVRINNNGEFIHHNAAVEKAGLLGVENVSHGCVNMGEVAAKEYYEAARYGDPVEVTGSTQDMTERDALYDWKYSTDEWQALSRLSS